MVERPRVSRAEFDQIECNRCGACCTKLWLPSPLKLSMYLAARETVQNPSEEWILENDRFVAWLSVLEPTGRIDETPFTEATHQYTCTRFVRLEDGSGFCTAHEDRPEACRGFPYGEPVHHQDFEECSYNVEIVEENIVGASFRHLRKAAQSIKGRFSAS